MFQYWVVASWAELSCVATKLNVTTNISLYLFHLRLVNFLVIILNILLIPMACHTVDEDEDASRSSQSERASHVFTLNFCLFNVFSSFAGRSDRLVCFSFSIIIFQPVCVLMEGDDKEWSELEGVNWKSVVLSWTFLVMFFYAFEDMEVVKEIQSEQYLPVGVK